MVTVNILRVSSSLVDAWTLSKRQTSRRKVSETRTAQRVWIRLDKRLTIAMQRIPLEGMNAGDRLGYGDCAKSIVSLGALGDGYFLRCSQPGVLSPEMAGTHRGEINLTRY